MSRPQSVNQWYPAMTVRTSSPAARARGLLGTPGGGDDELVRREYELRFEPWLLGAACN